MQTKDIAESQGLTVLHGIVDCVWVSGESIGTFRDRVERETNLPCEQEDYDWIVFLPLADGLGAYNRYFGRLSDGSIKVRGIAARRHDTPEFIRQMQGAMLSCMAKEKTITGLSGARDAIAAIRREYRDRLPSAPVQDLLISRRISRLTFDHRCLEGAAVQAYQQAGLTIAPGMKIRYVVRDARHYYVDTEWDCGAIDLSYYRNLLEKAADEIVFVFRNIPS
jgi:DNA polymerase I